MLRPRIIPCLLIHKKGLVKTQQFGRPKYVGDPLNAVRIFNEKEVDELIVVDIDATSYGLEPDYGVIRSLAVQCRMPLCYGGGVKTVEQAKHIVGMGVEKVAVSSAAVDDPTIVSRIAEVVGSQSVVVVMDVQRNDSNQRYEIVTHNSRQRRGLCPVQFAKKVASLGAGEIVVNSVDNDGMMKGYDMDLARAVREAVSLPMTVLGGAGCLDHLRLLIRELGVVGAAAGSLFVFKGVYRAVLISYPSRNEKEGLCLSAGLKANQMVTTALV